MQTWGSEEDVRPFVALADGLQDAGHDLTLAITCVDSDRYDGLTSKRGTKIRFVSSPVIPERRNCLKSGKRFSLNATHRADTDGYTKTISACGGGNVQTTEELCAENDFVIGHFFHYPLNRPRTSLRRISENARKQHRTGQTKQGANCHKIDN